MIVLSEKRFEELKESALTMSYQLGLHDNWFPTSDDINNKLDLNNLTENDVFFLLWASNTLSENLSLQQNKCKEYILDILENDEYIKVSDDIEFEKLDEKSKKKAFEDIFKKYGY